MKLMNDKFCVFPYEPSAHWPFLYMMNNSGNYQNFFLNCGLLDEVGAKNYNCGGKTFVIADSSNPSASVMGIITMTSINDHSRNFVYGIILNAQFHGKKIGKEATLAFLNYCFNNLNFYRVTFSVVEDNDAALGGLISIGASREGEMRGQFYRDGEFKNVMIYGMTKGDFNRRYRQKKQSEKARAA